MSFAGGATTLQWYFCHQCEETVTIAPPISVDPVCPICGDSFVEEIDSAFDSSNPGDIAGLLGLDSTPFQSQPPENTSFDIQLSSGGASIQVIFDGAGGSGGNFAGNVGDYVFGSGIEHAVHRIFENDSNLYGPPPAAKSAVEALPVIIISEEMVSRDDESQCAVCKDAFEAGAEAMQMPCKHIYHKDCIVPWLELHNSCPVCRYELPTEDPDYAQLAPGGILASAMEQRPPRHRTIQWRARNSVPQLFRGFRRIRAQAERSGNAGGTNDGSSSASWDENSEGSTD